MRTMAWDTRAHVSTYTDLPVQVIKPRSMPGGRFHHAPMFDISMVADSGEEDASAWESTSATALLPTPVAVLFVWLVPCSFDASANPPQFSILSFHLIGQKEPAQAEPRSSVAVHPRKPRCQSRGIAAFAPPAPLASSDYHS